MSRAEPGQVDEAARLIENLGVWRLRLADTVGVWTPAQAAEVFSNLKARLPDIHLGIHAHNDLGQAVAVSCAAVEAGATSVDTTILGVGERASNCALETFSLAMALQHQRPTTFDLSSSQDLAKMVSACLEGGIPAHQPVAGEQAFMHTSGIHIAQQLNDPLSCQPCSPDLVGARQHLIPSELNGKSARKYFANLS